MTFEGEFLYRVAVQAPKFGRQPTERPNQRKLRADVVGMGRKTGLLRKGQAQFGFALRFAERLAGDDKVRVQTAGCVTGIREVPDLVCGIESAALQVKRSTYMFRPRCDEAGKKCINARLEALQPAGFDEFTRDLTESKCSLIVAQALYGVRTER